MKNKSIVLIIEDDDHLRETVQMIVESTGREAWAARSGIEALELLTQRPNERPCLIILDMMMPEMDGAEFLKKRASDSAISKIPVVVVTAVRDVKFPTGAVKLRHKPLDFQDLIDDMNSICPNHVN